MDENGNPVVMNWKFGKEECRAAFSKACNNTASGFSGLPMTYWKAICKDDKLCEMYSALLETVLKERWLASNPSHAQKERLTLLHETLHHGTLQIRQYCSLHVYNHLIKWQSTLI